MGTFMEIAVCVNISIDKTQKSFEKNGLDNVIGPLGDRFDLSLFNIKDSKDYIEWKVKKELLEKQLTPFLVRQFSYFLDPYDSGEAIEELSKCKSSNDIIALAEEQEFQCFTLHNDFDGMRVGKWGDYVQYSYDKIVYCMDGKILMESYRGIFHYLEQMIRLQKEEFPIAGVVSVGISK
ncbi:MAG: hypothetical protein GY754_27950 [bacterium]|nr:hypothetical protein [bacterium]